jgi:hypothetical protein
MKRVVFETELMMRTARDRRSQLVPLFALAIITAGLPLEAGAQRTLRAGVSISDRVDSATTIASSNSSLSIAAVPSPPRRSMKPFLIGGVVAGAVVGALLAISFNDSFCGEPAPGYSCSSTDPVVGAMIGAGIGVFAGWLLWALTNPADPSARGG